MAYKRPNITMKKYIMLLMALFMSINGHTQDAFGYFNISQKTKDGILHFIGTPLRSVTFNKGDDSWRSDLLYSIDYYSLKKEEDNSIIKENYTLHFILTSFKEINIRNGGKLLIKYSDGEILTLTTDKYFRCEYDREGYNTVSPDYTIAKDDLDKIIKKGVAKLCFETTAQNVDIYVDKSFLMRTTDFVEGIEERQKNK